MIKKVNKAITIVKDVLLSALFVLMAVAVVFLPLLVVLGLCLYYQSFSVAAVVVTTLCVYIWNLLLFGIFIATSRELKTYIETGIFDDWYYDFDKWECPEDWNYGDKWEYEYKDDVLCVDNISGLQEYSEKVQNEKTKR